MTASSRLAGWWQDDPDDPGRLSMHDPDIRMLLARLAPHSATSDLGGSMSLNIKLDDLGVVLRVHQPFVSRQRLLALRKLRIALAGEGLLVAAPSSYKGEPLLRLRTRWAELETHVPHERLTPSLSSYLWLFNAMGRLHRTLATITFDLPRPAVATWSTPGTLRRWSRLGGSAVRGNDAAQEIVRELESQLAPLARQWVPPGKLPTQLIHGDVRLANVCRTPSGETVHFDFGFAALRPRVHDLAYAFAFMLLARGGIDYCLSNGWKEAGALFAAYESGSGSALLAAERQAISSYAAAIPLYQTAIAGLSEAPASQFGQKRTLLMLSDWLLAHPYA